MYTFIIRCIRMHNIFIFFVQRCIIFNVTKTCVTIPNVENSAPVSYISLFLLPTIDDKRVLSTQLMVQIKPHQLLHPSSQTGSYLRPVQHKHP